MGFTADLVFKIQIKEKVNLVAGLGSSFQVGRLLNGVKLFLLDPLNVIYCSQPTSPAKEKVKILFWLLIFNVIQ